MSPGIERFTQLAWTQLWQVTLLIVAVALAVRFFCRQRPHLAYALWLLVAIKCITPPLWSSPAGVFSWMTVKRAAPSTPSAQLKPPPATEHEQAREALPISDPPSGEGGPVEASPVISAVPPSPASPSQVPPSPVSSSIAAESIHEPAMTEPPPLPAILSGGWLAGVVLLANLIVFNWIRIHRRLLRGRVDVPDDLLQIVQRLRALLGLRRWVRLLVTSEPVGPAVFGFIRPRVVLPHALIEKLSPQALESVLAHELAHVRRWDSLAGFLQAVVQVLWWFHPLVWFANRQMSRERERCCDEEAVKVLNCSALAYARSLLDVLEMKRRVQSVFAVPGIRPVEITSKRLEDIVQRSENFRRRAPWWIWGVAFVGATLVLPGAGLLLQAESDDAGSKRSKTHAAAEDAVKAQPQTPYKPDKTERGAIAALEKLRAEITRNQRGEAKIVLGGYGANSREDIVGGLKQLRSIKNLRALRLYGLNVSDKGLWPLIVFPGLRSLDLRGCSNITEKGIAQLRKLPELQELRLGGGVGRRGLIVPGRRVRQFAIGDSVIEELPPNIIRLDLDNTQMSDAGLARLQKLKRLKTLHLGRTRITNAGLAHLKPLKLEELSLTGTGIDDGGIKHLEELRHLRRLFLGETKVTDAGLQQLAKLKQLEYLCVTPGKDRVTEDGIDDFQQARPKCEVVFLSTEEQKAIAELQKRDLRLACSFDTGKAVRLFFPPRRVATDAYLKVITVLTSLESLWFSFGVNDAGIPRRTPAITDEGLENLKGLKKLRSLNLDFTGITGAGLRHLKNLKELTTLHLSESQVTDEGLKHVGELKGLKQLTLQMTRTTDAGLVHLKRLTNLETLNLGGTRVTDAGLKIMKGLEILETLELHDTSVTDAGLEHLSKLTRLRKLDLGETKVTGTGFTRLKGLKNLQFIDLEDLPVADAELAHLKGLTNLKELGLDNTRVSDAGLKHLEGLTRLEELDLGETRITGAGLVYLKGLKNLSYLHLSESEVNDIALKHVGQLTSLQKLTLRVTKVTDGGLLHLNGLKNLKSVTLHRCGNITQRGVEELKKALPNCKFGYP